MGKQLIASSEAVVVVTHPGCPNLFVFGAVMECIRTAIRSKWGLRTGATGQVCLLQRARMTATTQGHFRIERAGPFMVDYFRLGGPPSKYLAWAGLDERMKISAVGRCSPWEATKQILVSSLHSDSAQVHGSKMHRRQSYADASELLCQARPCRSCGSTATK